MGTVPSDPSLGLNLSYRVAAIRRIVAGRVVFTTSFTLEDQAITHAIFSQGLAIDVLTLDTGRLFPETFEVWARTEHRYGRRILTACPDHAAAEALVRRQGINGFYRSIEARHACCAVRRVEPLRRALADAVAWVTGLRAGQPDERVGATFAIVAPRHRVIRVNPRSIGATSRSSRSFASTTFPIIPCMIAGSLRSAAPLARAPSNRESPRTLGGGGGSNVPNTSNAKNFAPWSLFPPHRHHRRRHHECH